MSDAPKRNTRAEPKVKELEWEAPCAANNQCHLAHSPLGTYYVHMDGGRRQAWLEGLTVNEEWVGEERGSTIEAEQDAQADYTRRILSALTPETET